MQFATQTNPAALNVVMYHYVRDLPRTKHPHIKGMMLDDFRRQVAWLVSRFEMATLQVALEFLRGTYRPARDLCVLTFDDGLKEHYTQVAPIIAEYGIQGLFGIITSCIEERSVAPVHMNHFLMAEMGFEAYQRAFIKSLRQMYPESLPSLKIDPSVAQRSYPLDTQEVANFKFLFNFSLDPVIRDKVVAALFEAQFGDEEAFSRELYMSWDEIRQVQRAGMLVAGHTHQHRPLSTLNDDELSRDLRASRALLDTNLDRQEIWPFSYPYGKRNSYSEKVVELVRDLGFACAFNTEDGPNLSGTHVFELTRIDCAGAIQRLQA